MTTLPLTNCYYLTCFCIVLHFPCEPKYKRCNLFQLTSHIGLFWFLVGLSCRKNSMCGPTWRHPTEISPSDSSRVVWNGKFHISLPELGNPAPSISIHSFFSCHFASFYYLGRKYEKQKNRKPLEKLPLLSIFKCNIIVLTYPIEIVPQKIFLTHSVH